MRSTNLELALTAWAFALGMVLLFAWLAPSGGSETEALMWNAGVTQVILALLALGGAAWTSKPLTERLGLGASAAAPATVLLLVVGFLGTSQSLESLLELAHVRETGTLAQLDAALSGVRGEQLALAFLVLGVAPGLGEELFARGWIQRGLVPYLGTGPAVVIAAAVFGALHADRVHSTAAFVLGLYLGAAVELTQSLRVSMLCHIANNLLWVTTAASASTWLRAGSSPRRLVALGLCGAGASALGLCVAFRGRRLRRMATHRQPVTKTEKDPEQPEP